MTAVEMEGTRSAVLDDAHVGDIRGALGTIRLDDTAARTTLSAKLKTLLAIVGPGLREALRWTLIVRAEVGPIHR